eukprot:TRINITY_DN5161_c0_g1_i1.p1 TRINITY_DN5161_c0_g1~~TRINITY_DN5161_c0_g1_i1.p1  ORF type:complete len:133 (+),score=11.95 TRINITY_DN5161_c0_g1_i1:166-564(+)
MDLSRFMRFTPRLQPNDNCVVGSRVGGLFGIDTPARRLFILLDVYSRILLQPLQQEKLMSEKSQYIFKGFVHGWVIYCQHPDILSSKEPVVFGFAFGIHVALSLPIYILVGIYWLPAAKTQCGIDTIRVVRL